ncbi:hypothetical protein BD770DRAFT_459236 [Pilaira anomala]|nr:hypothetical protein BD770DRAFT_459236 [Pilaira anomala]
MINKKRAFATSLCDDILSNTKCDIVVLVLHRVTQLTRDMLTYLDANIIPVDQVRYPWDLSASKKKGYNKACRYSKLSLWNLVQYEKISFMDMQGGLLEPVGSKEVAVWTNQGRVEEVYDCCLRKKYGRRYVKDKEFTRELWELVIYSRNLLKKEIVVTRYTTFRE